MGCYPDLYNHLLSGGLTLVMIPKHIVIIGMAALVAGCNAPRKGVAHSTEPPAHSFGIYLVSFTPTQPWSAAGLGDLAALRLDKKPVISDADILTYDFANHTLVVTRSALARMPDPPVWHQPFVVVADGQRIYLGAFSTMVSSCGTSVPTILVDFRDSTNELTIDLGYPAPGFSDGPDPRSDERIRTALAGLKKLK
jgi:hypothetical protein